MWLLWESTIKRWGLSRILWVFKYLTNRVPYSWSFCFVIYPLEVAVMYTPIGTSQLHGSWTHSPLWITMGGTTLLTPLTKVRIVEVSPWSAATVWYESLPLTHTKISSFGTFCTPVSSPDHIYSGELMCRSWRTCSCSVNHSLTLGSLAAMALVTLRFTAFLHVKWGNHFKKCLAQDLPAFSVSLVNPGMPFILAYCQIKTWYESLWVGTPWLENLQCMLQIVPHHLNIKFSLVDNVLENIRVYSLWLIGNRCHLK